MKILIYGAGVIGSLYAVLFSKSRNTDVSVYARGKRLEEVHSVIEKQINDETLIGGCCCE